VVKRRGIQDDIVGGIRSIVSPWLGTPPGEYKAVTEAKELTRFTAETLDQTFAGGMIKAGVQGNKALAKQAAINAAALGTGYIAGKAVQTAAGAVKSGRVTNPVAAYRNFVQDEKVIVVGTQAGYQNYVPTMPRVINVNQTLYPKLGERPVRWGFDAARTRSARELTESVSQYSNRWITNPKLAVERFPDGSTRPKFISDSQPEIVVGKVSKSSLSNEPVMPSWPPTNAQADALYKIRQGNLSEINNPSFRSGAVASTEPAKIVSRVSPILNPKTKQLKPVDVLERELVKAIRRAGGKVPKKPGKTVQTAAGAVAKKFLPSQIGLHHSVTSPTGAPFTGTVKASVQNKGLTAMDQKAGYSYFWDVGKGKSGISKAVREADFQTRNIADKIIFDEGQKAAAYVTKIPRGVAQSDTNVPGTIARQVKGTQKIVDTVTGSGSVYRGGMTQFSPQDLEKVRRAIQVAKRKEYLISAAKISGAIGGTAAVSTFAAKNIKRR